MNISYTRESGLSTHLESNGAPYPDIEKEKDEVSQVDEDLTGDLHSCGIAGAVVIKPGVLQVAPTWEEIGVKNGLKVVDNYKRECGVSSSAC